MCKGWILGPVRTTRPSDFLDVTFIDKIKSENVVI